VYVMTRYVLSRRRQVVRGPCWDGGIRKLSPEMTYTATGFSNPVRVIFEAVFHPTTAEKRPETVADHFRTAIHREREETHVVDRLLQPVRTLMWGLARRLAGMHHGRLNAYLAYVLVSLLAALLLSRVFMN